MADSDASLDILIRLGVIGQKDAQAARDLIKETSAATTTANTEDERSTGKLIGSKRELMHIINALGGQAVPELGRAFGTLAYGSSAVGAIFLLVGLVEMLKKKTEEAATAAAQLGEAKWEAAKASLAESVQSADDLTTALEKAGKSADTIKTAFDAAKALLDAQIADHKKILDLLEQEELAAVKGDKAKEDAIKREWEGRKRNYDLIAEQQKLEQITLDIGARKLQQDKLAGEAEGAREKLRVAENDPALAAANAALAGKDRLKLLAASGGGQYSNDDDERIRQIHADTGLSEWVAHGRLAAAEQLKAFDENTAIVAAHTESVRQLKAQSDAAAAAAIANTQAITDETATRDSGKAVLEEHQKAAKRQAAFEAVDKAGGFGNAGGIIGAGVSAIDAYQHGQRLTEVQTEAAATYRALFETVHGNTIAMVNIAKSALAHGRSQAQVIAQLQRDFENLKGASARVSPTGQ